MLWRKSLSKEGDGGRERRVGLKCCDGDEDQMGKRTSSAKAEAGAWLVCSGNKEMV